MQWQPVQSASIDARVLLGGRRDSGVCLSGGASCGEKLLDISFVDFFARPCECLVVRDDARSFVSA